ncbi:MAG: helix-turn-helix transcriptional regulator [Pseudomonadota bacterium]
MRSTEGTAAPRWQGGLRLGLGWGLFTGAAGHNSDHAHHAVQLLLSSTPQALWVDGRALPPCHGAIMGADVPHRVGAGDAPVTLLYIEPDSTAGRSLAATLTAGWRLLSERETAAALAACAAADPPAAVMQALTLQHNGMAGEGDALIESIIAALPRILPARLPVARLAAEAGLSPSRLQHRFRAHTGMALRPYLRWRRLLVALAAVRDGCKLTDAAMSAGFADAAHFTRTLRRHFGITPKVLLGLA